MPISAITTRSFNEIYIAYPSFISLSFIYAKNTVKTALFSLQKK
ncbi:hypothetical protein TREVI0001_0420 [Treponema vincentii ATCC 35580]|uniref:Uncharacterized protein n=1 Tax=Treponema vincentii ATCC 35580 TaxID=596324 RepID=C8PQ52_9SPIR|nr:hypothetical protein TREVI0001_0420 [Treponema vincentii ATCC 35580]